MDDQSLMTVDEVAAILKIKRQALQHRRDNGKGPPFVRVGKRVLYPRDKFDEWIVGRIQCGNGT